MPLHEQIRNRQVFDEKNLGRIQEKETQEKETRASVLLRTVSLVALTQTEHSNPNTIELHKLHPINDNLFVFRKDNNGFPARDSSDIDIKFINGEYPNVNLGVGSELNTMEAFWNEDNNQRINHGWTQHQLDQLENNITAEAIFNDYNINIINPQNISFFDQINSFHNIHKKLVRKNAYLVNELINNDTRNITTSTPDCGPTTTIECTKSGNFGSTLVKSWGKYDGTVRTRRAFENLRNHLIDNAQPLNADGTILKDLYMLECIREPAALLTNAMYIDLASYNNGGGFRFKQLYEFRQLHKKMPMAIKHAVQMTRSLWKKIILDSTPDLTVLYYRYDYVSYESSNRQDLDKLTNLENNLLFNYILFKSLDSNDRTWDYNSLTRLNNLLTPHVNIKQQILVLRNLGFEQLKNLKFYQKSITLNNNIGTIRILVDVQSLQFNENLSLENLYITRFPLKILWNLMNEWYHVDLAAANPNLADLNIEIDLKLR